MDGRRLFPPQVRAEVIRLACERPVDSDVPLARWSSTELAREAVTRGICEQISEVTVWRWLSEDAIKPWQHRSWIFPRDPNFTAKAGPILDLYGLLSSAGVTIDECRTETTWRLTSMPATS